MKAMILSDLIVLKGSFPTMIGITIFVSVFIAIATGMLPTAAGSMAAMMPFMYVFTISAYDEQNGWERFRLTLPVNRHQVAYGRYASILIVTVCSLIVAIIIALLMGSICDVLPAGLVSDDLRLSGTDLLTFFGVGVFAQIIILAAIALTFPIIMRFGMTKGARLVPIILVLALSAAMAYFGRSADIALIDGVAFNAPAILLVLTVAVLALYAASSFVSARLYDHRSL